MDTNELLDEWEDGRNLELASVENPTLTIKNKFNADDLTYVSTRYEGNTFFETNGTTLEITMNGGSWARTIFNFDYEIGKKYNLSFIPIFNEGDEDGNWCVDFNGDMGNRTYFKHGELFSIDFTPTGENLIQLCRLAKNQCLFTNFVISEVGMKDIPYKNAIITTDEEITLRGIGEVRDELDLIKGELTQSLNQSEFKSAEHITTGTITTLENTIRWQTTSNFRDIIRLKTIGKIMSNTLISSDSHEDFEHIRLDGSSPNANIIIYLDKTKATTHTTLDIYLKNNPLTFVAQKTVDDIKTTNLTHTYTFPQTKSRRSTFPD